MSAQYPVRTKRKQRTRQVLVDSALELFSVKGYEDTTLEEIAHRAGLHVQTLYRHFPSKPLLATAVDRSVMEEFTRAIRNPDRAANTFEFWREWIQISIERVSEPDLGLERYRRSVQHRYFSPRVSNSVLLIGFEYEQLLAESLAVDFSMDVEQDRLPRLVACMLYAANLEAVRRFAHEDDFDLLAETTAVVDAAEELFDRYLKR